MDGNDEARALLESLDYVPTVRRWRSGCMLSLPQSVLPGRRRDGLVIGVCPTAEGVAFTASRGGTHEVRSPGYAVRAIVEAVVARESLAAGIDPSLASYRAEDGSPVPSIDGVLPPPEDLAREASLRDVVRPAFASGFTREREGVAVEHGVLDGYLLVKSAFLRG